MHIFAHIGKVVHMNNEEGTRDILIESLIGLMKEHPLNEITIKEIVYKAGVSRRTFYNYFSSVQQAVEAHAIALIRLTIRKIEINKEFSNDLIAKFFFETGHHNKDFFKLLLNDPSINPISMFELFLDTRITHFGMGRIPQLKINQKDYITSFVVGGVFNLFQYWINTDDTEDVNEVINIYSKLMNKIESVNETDGYF